MSRIALLSSEPLRPQMAGIGIRYLELARHLPRPGIDCVLIASGDPEEAARLVPDAVQVRPFVDGGLKEVVHDCDAAIAQGQLANNLLLEVPELPTAIDLYDPWLVENLHYHATLGLDPYRNDHATWILQLSRGDFFLCSSAEQRQFYLGFLTAVGRVNPQRLRRDPDLMRLIAPVPFGIPSELPTHDPLLPPRPAGERRLLFGGLYDWYDPWPLLEALERLDRRHWKLLFIRNPNPQSTPQQTLAQVHEWISRRPAGEGWRRRVEFLDWVPYERRYDLLRDVDLLVATHRDGLETLLSLRTRFLEALAAGCSVLTTEGGTVSRLLREWDAGWVVPPGDPKSLMAAMVEALEDTDEGRRRRQRGETRIASFHWHRVLKPLVEFCRQPRQDPTKEDFAHPLPTRCPPDPFGFRLRRWWRARIRE